MVKMERIILLLLLPALPLRKCFFLSSSSPPFSPGEQRLAQGFDEMSFDGLEALRAAHSSSSHPAELTITHDINASDSRVNRWWSPLPGVLGSDTMVTH